MPSLLKVIRSAAGNPLTVREHHSMLLMLFKIREMSKQRSENRPEDPVEKGIDASAQDRAYGIS